MYSNTNNDDHGMQFHRAPTTGYIRVLHASPDAPNVDVYANDDLIAAELAFGESTDYIAAAPGDYIITVYAAGTQENPVLSNTLTLEENANATVAAIGTLDDLQLLAIPDSDLVMEAGTPMVRFVHLSPNAPAVDVTLPTGRLLFSDVAFTQRTPYIPAPPRTYTLQVRVAGSPDVVLTVPDVTFEPSMMYTIYAIGLAGDEPELQALLLTDR